MGQDGGGVESAEVGCREQANEIDGQERKKEGGKDRWAAADLKNQGPELATVNFSSYS